MRSADKPNKPQNVVDHRHFWASPEHEEAEAGRIDVCLLSDGEAVLWDVDRDRVMRAGTAEAGQRWTWDQAIAEAEFFTAARADLARGKWVRVMCDHCADPLWAKDGTPADLEDLPVSADLRHRLYLWSEKYQGAGGFGDIELTVPLAPGAIEVFGAEGLALALAVKAALPDWTVIYFDEAKAQTAHWDGPRDIFEYEIKAG